MSLTFRDLTADDIECRISTVKKNGVSLLLYKDARCDMNILDETVGPENWQRNHELINGNLFCNVGICINDNWVWKQDVGTESYTEKEKGQASDAFKRACFNWGIGRELYTAPFIWIGAENCKIEPDRKNPDKFVCYDKFSVKWIAIENKRITELEIADKKGNTVFAWSNQKISAAQVRTLEMMIPEHGQTVEKVCKTFQIKSLDELYVGQFQYLMDAMGANDEG